MWNKNLEHKFCFACQRALNVTKKKDTTNDDRGATLNVTTTENLFEHKCQIKDMKLSGFNPETLMYYCQECGGKLIIKRTKKADAFIKKNATLKLTKKLLDLST